MIDIIGLYDPDNLYPSNKKIKGKRKMGKRKETDVSRYTDNCTGNATLDATATQTPNCVTVFDERSAYLNVLYNTKEKRRKNKEK